MRSPTIVVVDPRADDVLALLEDHWAFTREVTPPQHIHALDMDGLLDPAVTVFGLCNDGTLLGIGAIKQLDDDHVEVKSMHTAANARRQGVGEVILNHLLSVATDRGAKRVSLETGSYEAFAPARLLYQQAGFRVCEPFGDYRPSELSTFMTLLL